MRRFLIGLTLVVLLAVSIGVGVLVAEWPSLPKNAGSRTAERSLSATTFRTSSPAGWPW